MGESPPKIDELRHVGLFGGVSDEVLEFLASKLVILSPRSGDIVFREGDTARDMFVVMSGEMEVQKRSQSGVDARVALLGPGDWFGEMRILDVQTRSSCSPSRASSAGACSSRTVSSRSSSPA